MKVTAQIVRLDDADTKDESAPRYEALLDNLDRHLRGKLRFRPRPVTSG